MRGWTGVASRVLFGVAVAAAGLAIWVKLASLVGLRLVVIGGYTPSSLFEVAAVALLFVIAMQLREIAGGMTGPPGTG